MVQYTEEHLVDLLKRGHLALVRQIQEDPNAVIKKSDLVEKFGLTFREMEARGVDFTIGHHPVSESDDKLDHEVLSDIAQGKHLRGSNTNLRHLDDDTFPSSH